MIDKIAPFLSQIQSEALSAYPKEAVWLLTESGLISAENVHEDPENHFEVSETESFRAYKEGLLAVVHSHCDGVAAPSEHDMVVQERMGVPWGVLNVIPGLASGITWWGDTKHPKLLGRGFIHGISDCYSIVEDFHLAHGIRLKSMPRNWQWWETEEKFSQHWEDYGFEMIHISEARKGDVWISQIRTPFENHCGVFLDCETVLHHPGSSEAVDHGRLSVVEPVYRYLPYITKVLRHKEADKFALKEVSLEQEVVYEG